MRIAIVGGLFRKGSWQVSGVRTPETILRTGLLESGHDIEVFSHQAPELSTLGSFDVIHVHHLSWGAVLAAELRRRRRIGPVVLTTHANIDNGLRRFLASKLVYRSVDAIVALSESEALRYPSESKTIVIPNGVDVGDAYAKGPCYPYAGGTFKLLYVGQLVPVKQLDKLLEAVALASRRVHVRLRLVYHNAQLEGELRQQAAELGINDHIDFIGLKTGTDLWHQFRENHCLILPSRTEALPSVLTEAALIGLPVIASDVGGVRSQVASEDSLVAWDCSAEELSDRICMRSKEWSTALARSLRFCASADDHFGVAKMIGAHESLYELLREPESDRPPALGLLPSRALSVAARYLTARADRLELRRCA